MLILLWGVLAINITEMNMQSGWKSIFKIGNFFPIGIFLYLDYCCIGRRECLLLPYTKAGIFRTNFSLLGRGGLDKGPLPIFFEYLLPLRLSTIRISINIYLINIYVPIYEICEAKNV
jgi:hypothetical protein